MGYVYKLDFASGKSYIGATTQPYLSRIRRHELTAEKGPDGCFFFSVHEAWRQYGKPTIELIAEVDDSLLHLAEVEAIAKYGTMSPDGYNLTSGGRRTKFVAASNRKKSEAFKGRSFSDETRKRMSEAQRARDPNSRHYLGPVWRGKKQSPEHVAKRIRTGWKHSEESKRKMSAKSIGHVTPDHIKLKISETMKKVRKSQPWSTRKI
jgi:hypothetical protein